MYNKNGQLLNEKSLILMLSRVTYVFVRYLDNIATQKMLHFNKVDLHPSKALFSLDPDNLQLRCFLRVGSIVLLFVLLSSRPTM